MEIKSLDLEGLSIDICTFGDPKDPKVFLAHGYSLEHDKFPEFPEALSDEGRFVTVPILYGINKLRNFGQQPSTVDGYCYVTLDILANTGYLDDRFQMIGHSMGGKIAVKLAHVLDNISDVVLLNKMMPVDYNDPVRGYTRRMLSKSFGQVMGKEGRYPMKKFGAYALMTGGWNFMKNLVGTVRLLQDMAKDGFDGLEVEQPVLDIYGPNDHFFEKGNNNGLIKKVCKNIVQIEDPRIVHDSVINQAPIILAYMKKFDRL